jgi:hypothetical protein
MEGFGSRALALVFLFHGSSFHFLMALDIYHAFPSQFSSVATRPVDAGPLIISCVFVFPPFVWTSVILPPQVKNGSATLREKHVLTFKIFYTIYLCEIKYDFGVSSSVRAYLEWRDCNMNTSESLSRVNAGLYIVSSILTTILKQQRGI